MFYRETVAPAAVVGGGGAPDVMVVPVTDGGGGGVGTGPGGPLSGSGAGQEVSANVTVETTRASSVGPQPATGSSVAGKSTSSQSSAKQQIVQLGIPHDVLLGESESIVENSNC